MSCCLLASSRVGSTEGVCNSPSFVATCWTLEECVLAACTSAPLGCPHHADVQLADVAPDTVSGGWWLVADGG